jgi:tRNA 5-methylaminomethyl-2-thiouridine biosynthesis bifunctional protein
MKIAIIGAGLAGTSCAYVLKKQGHDVEIYEASGHIASGASGNDVGLYNPRLSAHKDAHAKFYEAAFFKALETFGKVGAEKIDLKRCGALHLMSDDKKQIRYSKTFKNWRWPDHKMRIVDAAEASQIAGVEIRFGALYLSDAGCVSPKKLCHAYTQNIPVHLNTRIENLDDIEADRVILACGAGMLKIECAAHLPLMPVRGQITAAKSSGRFSNLKTNLCHGGYCTPEYNGSHMIGATFQRLLEHSDCVEDDDLENIEKLEQIISGVGQELTVVDHRASVRVSSKDYMPVVGALNDRVYISGAHGSHGIVGSIIAAHIIAKSISGHLSPVSDDTLSLLNPARFCGT